MIALFKNTSGGSEEVTLKKKPTLLLEHSL